MRVTRDRFWDVERCQCLQDSFANLTDLTAGMVDREGQYLTKPSKLYGFCGLMNSLEKGRDKCTRARRRMAERTMTLRKSDIAHCPHSGVLMGGVPFYAGGELQACWVVCQACTSEPDTALLTYTANELGMLPGTLIGCLTGQPKLTRTEFTQMLGFLGQISDAVRVRPWQYRPAGRFAGAQPPDKFDGLEEALVSRR